MSSFLVGSVEGDAEFVEKGSGGGDAPLHLVVASGQLPGHAEGEVSPGCHHQQRNILQGTRAMMYCP